MAVILNIEADHLDFFKDLEDVEHSFRAFADLVPPGGTVLANGEDQNTMDALAGKKGVRTFGLHEGDFHAENLTWEHGFPSFDVVCDGKPAVHITLQMIRLIKVPFSITLGTAQMNKIDTVSPTFHDTRQIILCRYAK